MLSDIAGRLRKQNCKNAAGHEYEIQCFVLKIGTSHSVDRAGFFFFLRKRAKPGPWPLNLVCVL